MDSTTLSPFAFFKIALLLCASPLISPPRNYGATGDNDVCISHLRRGDSCNCTRTPPVLPPSPPICCKECYIETLPPHLNGTCEVGRMIPCSTVCQFHCDIGFSLTGESNITCSQRGSFSDDLPTCEDISCLVDNYSTPLSSSCAPNSSVIYNSTCGFSCGKDYGINGSVALRCVDEGEFDESIPACEQLLMGAKIQLVNRKRRSSLFTDNPTVQNVREMVEATVQAIPGIYFANVEANATHNVSVDTIQVAFSINILYTAALTRETLIHNVSSADYSTANFQVTILGIKDLESLLTQCAPNPCRNDGRCEIDFFSLNFTCDCQGDSSGIICEISVDKDDTVIILTAILVPIATLLAGALLIACTVWYRFSRRRHLTHYANEGMEKEEKAGKSLTTSRV